MALSLDDLAVSSFETTVPEMAESRLASIPVLACSSSPRCYPTAIQYCPKTV
jgi:hypothetical protein